MSNNVEVQPHYPYVTRSLLELYAEGALTNVADVLVEPEYGYAARISYTNGNHRITYGNDIGLNTSSASELANDKGHTKFVLRAIGVNCPRGSEFLLPWWAERISGAGRMHDFAGQRTTESAVDFIEQELGYPVYVKPVVESNGIDVHKVHTPEELDEVFASYAEKRVRVAMVEEPVDMPDYRIVILDGEPISAYRRDPLMVTGDGEHTIRQLLESLRQAFIAAGRDTRIDVGDPRITTNLKRQGRGLSFVPASDTRVVLSNISNLSAGGTSEDVTDIIHRRWAQLAADIAHDLNLRLCGVDVACADITNGDSLYSVLEVNSSPGLDHYAASGVEQQRIVRELYAKVFNALP